MICGVRKNEISNELRQIELAHEELDHFIKNFKEEEENTYEYLSQQLKSLEYEFELGQGNQQMLTLLEERNERLRDAQGKCGEFLGLLETECPKIQRQCEDDIAELKRALIGLEMI